MRPYPPERASAERTHRIQPADPDSSSVHPGRRTLRRVTKLDDARAGLRRDPGQWAAGQREQGTDWARIAQQLYVLTGVSVAAKTVRQWAEQAR